MNNKITNTDINEFEEFLINKNKSRTTLDKYMRIYEDFKSFFLITVTKYLRILQINISRFLKMLITV